MEPTDVSKVVREVVERVVRRLEDASHGDLPTAADERLFGERRARLQQAVAEGACRLFPQAIPLDQCSDFAGMTELTLLRPAAREADIRALCRDAIERGFVSVCVDLEWTEVAASSLKGSNTRLCVPIGFPAGGISTEFKAAEVRRAVALGADEVDVVINVARLREADYRAAIEDLQTACRAAQGRTVKAVIEAAALTAEQKVAAAILAKSAGAQLVKSSTGFGPDPITVGDVALIRSALAGKPNPLSAAKPEWLARVGAVVSIAVAA
jgi:deoxyribose-phosphate aldolase